MACSVLTCGEKRTSVFFVVIDRLLSQCRAGRRSHYPVITPICSFIMYGFPKNNSTAFCQTVVGILFDVKVSH